MQSITHSKHMQAQPGTPRELLIDFAGKTGTDLLQGSPKTYSKGPQSLPHGSLFLTPRVPFPYSLGLYYLLQGSLLLTLRVPKSSPTTMVNEHGRLQELRVSYHPRWPKLPKMGRVTYSKGPQKLTPRVPILPYGLQKPCDIFVARRSRLTLRVPIRCVGDPFLRPGTRRWRATCPSNGCARSWVRGPRPTRGHQSDS